MTNKNQGILTTEEKELLSQIVNTRPFVTVWGRANRCTYCKNYIMGICAKGLIKSTKLVCNEFCMVDYLEAKSICRLCKHSTLRDTCNDKDMKIPNIYCMYDADNPIKIGATSSACNKFKSCLEVKPNEISPLR